jgi:hypothetical protein
LSNLIQKNFCGNKHIKHWASCVIKKGAQNEQHPMGENSPNLGPMFMILKIFSPKKIAKIGVFDSKQS